MSTTFADLGVSEAAVRRAGERGITAPFPVQRLVVPDVLAGRDVLVKSPTGSGKTLAFGVPLLDRVARRRPTARRRSCSPRRASSPRQIVDELARRRRGPRARASPPSTAASACRRRRSAPAARTCSSPRPAACSTSSTAATCGSTASACLVLDEADRMLDMGFKPVVDRIVADDAARPPDAALLRHARRRGRHARARRTRATRAATSTRPRPSGAATWSTASCACRTRPRSARSSSSSPSPGAAARSCSCAPSAAPTGSSRSSPRTTSPAVAMHGDKSQGQRERALAGFEAGRVDTLVATDVAARGIDVADITHVINYDAPAAREDYVHRIGRTARAGRARRRHHLRDGRPGARHGQDRPRARARRHGADAARGAGRDGARRRRGPHARAAPRAARAPAQAGGAPPATAAAAVRAAPWARRRGRVARERRMSRPRVRRDHRTNGDDRRAPTTRRSWRTSTCPTWTCTATCCPASTTVPRRPPTRSRTRAGSQAEGVRDVACTPHIKRADFPRVRIGELAGAAPAHPGHARRGGPAGAPARRRRAQPRGRRRARAGGPRRDRPGPAHARWLLLECPFAGIDAAFLDAVARLGRSATGCCSPIPSAPPACSTAARRARSAGSATACAAGNVCSLLGNHGLDVQDAALALLRRGIVECSRPTGTPARASTRSSSASTSCCARATSARRCGSRRTTRACCSSRACRRSSGRRRAARGLTRVRVRPRRPWRGARPSPGSPCRGRPCAGGRPRA